MSAENTPRKRGRPRANEKDRLKHVVQLRLNNAQYSYAYTLADFWQCPVGEAIRRLIDQALDSDPTEVDGMLIDGRPASLRESLEIVSPTPEWIAEHIRRVGEEES